MSQGKTIDYWFASDAFRQRGVDWLKKGDPLPRSATLIFNSDPGRVESGDRIEASSSLLEWFGDGPARELSEDVVGLGSYGKTLTVLFAEDWPDEEEEADEALGSDEPTFHRSRRR